MDKAICQVSVAPVRAEAKDSSEMVTQLLFGEFCEIIDSENNWLKIRIIFDNYEGWIDYKQISNIQDIENYNSKFYLNEPFNMLYLDDVMFPVTIGAEIYKSDNSSEFEIGEGIFSTEKINSCVNQILDREKIVELSYKYLNTPYLWGGKSTFGIDCSGLTQMVYKIAGYKLPRDASQQAEIGEVLTFIEEAIPGDLAFFENSERKIIHVGIILKGQKIIHAHGKVRIDTIDSNGIFNLELKKYTHKLRLIRKII